MKPHWALERWRQLAQARTRDGWAQRGRRHLVVPQELHEPADGAHGKGSRSLSLVSGLCSAVHGRGEGHGGHPWRRWNREHGLCFRVSVQPTRVGLGRGDQKSVPSRARGQAGSAAQSSANGAQCLPVALLQLPVPAPVLRARGRARPEASSETAVAPGSTWARAAPSSASSPWSAVTRSPHVQHTWKGFEI